MHTSMKTRTATGKLKTVKYVDDDEDSVKGDDIDDAAEAIAHEKDDSDDEHLPLKNRRRSHKNTSKSGGSSTNTGKGKGNLYRGKSIGKLAKLLEMPVDIFCEISAYLEPLDLLRLARSTRGLNNMLMSRNSRPIWRTARRHYPDLPACPADLSEPEYARLLFERDCHACFAPRVLKVDCVLRARICYRCRSSNIVKGTQLIKTVPGLTEELLECIPCRNDQWPGCQACGRPRRFEYFYRPRVQDFVTKFYTAVPQGLSPEAQVQRDEFFSRNKALIKDMVKHAEEVEKWLASDRQSKITEGFEANGRRQASIRAKLVELGYSEEDFPTSWDEPDWIQVMEQPRDLTPRIWATVRPRLEASIQRVKSRREEQDRQTRKAIRQSELRSLVSDILKERKEQDMRLTIHLGNVLELPTVDAMIKEDDYGQPITPTKWYKAWSQIEKEMKDYADNARKGLIRLITDFRQNKTSTTHGPVHDPVMLPSDGASSEEANANVDTTYSLSYSTFFKCTSCLAILQYPALLDHTHTCRVYPATWSLGHFSFDTAATAIAEKLASAISDTALSWIASQREDISALGQGHQLQCLRCDENISSPMGWAQLVHHFAAEQEWYDGEINRRRANPSFSWFFIVTIYNDHSLEDSDAPLVTVLDPEGAAAQRQRLDMWTTGHPARWTCGLCNWPQRKSRQDVALHIRSKHWKASPAPGDIVQSTEIF